MFEKKESADALASPGSDLGNKNPAKLKELFDAILNGNKTKVLKIAETDPELFFQSSREIVQGLYGRGFGVGTSPLHILLWSVEPMLQEVIIKLQGTSVEVTNTLDRNIAPDNWIYKYTTENIQAVLDKKKVFFFRDYNGPKGGICFASDEGQYIHRFTSNSELRNIIQKYAVGTVIQDVEELNKISSYFNSTEISTLLDKALVMKKRIEEYQYNYLKKGLQTFTLNTPLHQETFYDFSNVAQKLERCVSDFETLNGSKRIIEFNESLKDLPVWVAQMICNSDTETKGMKDSRYWSMEVNYECIRNQPLELRTSDYTDHYSWSDLVENKMKSSVMGGITNFISIIWRQPRLEEDKPEHFAANKAKLHLSDFQATLNSFQGLIALYTNVKNNLKTEAEQLHRFNSTPITKKLMGGESLLAELHSETEQLRHVNSVPVTKEQSPTVTSTVRHFLNLFFAQEGDRSAENKQNKVSTPKHFL